MMQGIFGKFASLPVGQEFLAFGGPRGSLLDPDHKNLPLDPILSQFLFCRFFTQSLKLID
jgi:hypothetical protein